MRIVVTGASGQLGAYLVNRLESSGLDVHALGGQSQGRPLTRKASTWAAIDLSQPQEIENSLEIFDPEVIIHLAAISSADAVRADPARGHAINVTATEHLADWCSRNRRRLLFTSTDLVFDGTRSFYQEEDIPSPILEYGRTKVRAEQAVRKSSRGVVARLSLLYGFAKSERIGFFDRAISSLKRGDSQTFFEDEFRTPLDYGSAAAILVSLALSDLTGVIHVAGRERVSRWELMSRAARSLGLDPTLVKSNLRDDTALVEPRPRDVSLDTSQLLRLYPELGEWSIEKGLSA